MWWTVVKQRLQMYKSPYGSMMECVRQVYRSEGLAAFYRSYGTQIVMNVPFQCAHFVAYEAMQNATNPQRAYAPLCHMTSGAVSGAVAAAVTTPLDVCKTLLNTQEAGALRRTRQTHISGLANAFAVVYRLGGLRAFSQVRLKLASFLPLFHPFSMIRRLLRRFSLRLAQLLGLFFS